MIFKEYIRATCWVKRTIDIDVDNIKNNYINCKYKILKSECDNEIGIKLHSKDYSFLLTSKGEMIYDGSKPDEFDPNNILNNANNL